MVDALENVTSTAKRGRKCGRCARKRYVYRTSAAEKCRKFQEKWVNVDTRYFGFVVIGVSGLMPANNSEAG